MVVPVPTEVIPIWFIEKWEKENADPDSALDHFIKVMIKDWNVEEARQKTKCWRICNDEQKMAQ